MAFVCNTCGKKYKFQSGLSKHKKKHKVQKEISVTDLIINFKNQILAMEEEHESVLSKIAKSWTEEKKYIEELEEENFKLKEKIRKYES
jgi:hypothetical protein